MTASGEVPPGSRAIKWAVISAVLVEAVVIALFIWQTVR
jgi:hypothetical protein